MVLFDIKKILVLFTILFLLWIFITVSVGFDKLLVGGIASFLISILTHNLAIKGNVKDVVNPIKWLNLIKYLLYYLFNAEIKAHLIVIKLILKGKKALKSGIVEVPYYLKSDLGITLLANFVTNTPGTVTIEVDKSKNRYFIHWICVESFKPEDCYKMITYDFEKGIRGFCN